MAQYNTSISNDIVMKVLTKSECCFCLISVARKVTPPVNKRSTFQSFGRVTGYRCHRQQTHDGDRSPDVSDTISNCLPEYAENSSHQGSHLTECAAEPNNKSRTSQSARENQTKDSRCSKCARDSYTVRTARSARILELQIEIDKLVLGRVLTQGQLLNRFCGHQGNTCLCTKIKTTNATQFVMIQDEVCT